MKNVLRMSMVVVFLLSGIGAKASEILNVSVTENQNLLVILDQVEVGTVLLLQDENGNILYKDSILSKESFRRILNLEEIARGNYFLSLETENHIHSTVLVKKSKGIEVKEEESKITFKPRFQVENDKVRFFLANSKEDNIQVTIYDQEGVAIGNFTSSENIIKKTLDFSNVPSGKFILQVRMKDKEFFRELAVE